MAKADDKKIDGYTLSERMRKARRKHPLYSTEQALFAELVAICNEEEWVDIFSCSNEELCNALRISENTLIAARHVLIQAHLVYYQSGKSKRQFSRYSFTHKFPTTSKSAVVGAGTTSKSEVNTGTNASANRGVNPSANAADLLIGKTETESKPNQTSGTDVPGTAAADAGNSDSGIAPGQPGPGKRKKGSAQKKKDEDVTPHWQALAARWIAFYVDKFKIEPTFWDAGAGESRAALALIMKRLKKQTELAEHTKGQEWTEEYALRVLTHFLIKAYSDKWRAENFRLTILSSHYDSIVNPNGKQQSNSKTGPDGVLNADHKRDLAERLAKATGQSGA